MTSSVPSASTILTRHVSTMDLSPSSVLALNIFVAALNRRSAVGCCIDDPNVGRRHLDDDDRSALAVEDSMMIATTTVDTIGKRNISSMRAARYF